MSEATALSAFGKRCIACQQSVCPLCQLGAQAGLSAVPLESGCTGSSASTEFSVLFLDHCLV